MVGMARVRARVVRRASLGLWKEEYMGAVRSRGSDKEPLEALLRGCADCNVKNPKVEKAGFIQKRKNLSFGLEYLKILKNDPAIGGDGMSSGCEGQSQAFDLEEAIWACFRRDSVSATGEKIKNSCVSYGQGVRGDHRRRSSRS